MINLDELAVLNQKGMNTILLVIYVVNPQVIIAVFIWLGQSITLHMINMPSHRRVIILRNKLALESAYTHLCLSLNFKVD